MFERHSNTVHSFCQKSASFFFRTCFSTWNARQMLQTLMFNVFCFFSPLDLAVNFVLTWPVVCSIRPASQHRMDLLRRALQTSQNYSTGAAVSMQGATGDVLETTLDKLTLAGSEDIRILLKSVYYEPYQIKTRDQSRDFTKLVGKVTDKDGNGMYYEVRGKDQRSCERQCAASQLTAATQLSLSASQTSPAEVRTSQQECQFEVVHAKPALIADFDESRRPCVPTILRLEARFKMLFTFYMFRIFEFLGLGDACCSFCHLLTGPPHRRQHRAGVGLGRGLGIHGAWSGFHKSRCDVRLCDHPCQDHGGGRSEKFADSWCSMDEVHTGYTYFWFPKTFCCGRGYPNSKGFAI